MTKKKTQTHEILNFGAFKVPLIKNRSLEDCYGRYKALPNPMIEYNGCTGVNKESTVFHEMLHFISDQFELELSEAQVRVMEHAIPQLIHENPGKFNALMGL